MLHPKLYKRDSKGRTRFWQMEDDGAGRFRSISGLIDGESITNDWTICEAKNVGRSNETTPAQQAASEIESLYQKKVDNHYVDSIAKVNDARAYFEVMLANSYEDVKSMINWAEGIDSQPKLDGLRGPTVESGTFSRKGKEYLTVRWISQEVLAPLFEAHPDIVIDGELYNHDYHDDFNEITSKIKRAKPSADDIAAAREFAQLHVYDAFFPDEPEMKFRDRYKKITALLKEFGIDPKYIVMVPTKTCYSEAEFDAEYEVNIELSYEGQMGRFNKKYFHKRVDWVFKRKDFLDAEFEVVEILPGKGKWANAAKKVRARLSDGRIFGAGVKGKKDYLIDVLKNPEKYTHATILFFKPTPDGIPRFARVKTFHIGERDD
jgi:DNA ligase-1